MLNHIKLKYSINSMYSYWYDLSVLHQMVEKTFAELSPIVVAEQEFCVNFFHMSQAAEGDTTEWVIYCDYLTLFRCERYLGEVLIWIQFNT